MPPRIRHQLAIQFADPSLLQRLRDEAERQRRTTTSLVLEWIEAGLAGGSAAPAADDALEARVAALEAAVGALQQQGASPNRVMPPARSDEAASPDRVTTADLARLLGLNRGTLQARVDRKGGAAEGLELDGWRCVGRVSLPSGGPRQWVWEPV